MREKATADFEFAGYELVGVLPRVEVERALAFVEASLQPASREVVIRELTRLRVAMPSRELSEEEIKLQTAVYAKEVGAYPEDAIRTAVEEYIRTGKWWPALAELIRLLNRAVEKRMSLRFALEAKLKEVPPPTDAPKIEGGKRWSQMTDEEKAAHRAWMKSYNEQQQAIIKAAAKGMRV